MKENYLEIEIEFEVPKEPKKGEKIYEAEKLNFGGKK